MLAAQHPCCWKCPQETALHPTTPVPPETLRLLANSQRPWPSGAAGLRAAARYAQEAEQLVVECETLAAAPVYADDGAPANVEWRDDAS